MKGHGFTPCESDQSRVASHDAPQHFCPAPRVFLCRGASSRPAVGSVPGAGPVELTVRHLMLRVRHYSKEGPFGPLSQWPTLPMEGALDGMPSGRDAPSITFQMCTWGHRRVRTTSFHSLGGSD